MSFPCRWAAFFAVLVAACSNSQDRPALLADELNEVPQPGWSDQGLAGAAGAEGAAGAASSPGPVLTNSSGCTKGEYPTGASPFDDAGIQRLEGYTTIKGNFYIIPPGIETRTSVTDLRPLHCLQTVTEATVISDSPDLTTLAGLESLRLSGNLSIFDNPQLTTLEAFQDLSVGRLIVTRNDSLRELGQGIVAVAEFEIESNSVLPQCAVEAMAERLGRTCDISRCGGNDADGTCN